MAGQVVYILLVLHKGFTMRILLTGATGYIGRRLLPVLLEMGHEVVCCVRDLKRFDITAYDTEKVSLIEVNFLDKESLSAIPEDIDAAYYLLHSLSASIGDFETLESITASNFRERMDETNVRHVIYLSGITNESALSEHLRSRRQVEDILSGGSFKLTTLRAGIIVGSGSASFEIIRDLVEKLPLMIAPRWLNTKAQPIAVRNVIQFLTGVIANEKTYGQNYDIGGPDILTYREMLERYAAIRNLKRKIYVLPIMTPKLSSYWLYFVTATSYKLAVNLVDSMKVEVICRPNNLAYLIQVQLLPYEEAIRLAFDKTEQQEVVSSWTDALSGKALGNGISSLIQIPSFGCFKDVHALEVNDAAKAIERIWAIGGDNGWYYANWIWNIRGFLDKLAGGVGRRRGRKNQYKISAGDSLDFWRVLYANKKEKRLLLYAEMKMPGEAWLEFRINETKLMLKTTFRPLGLYGRLYWYILFPFHRIIFRGMAKKIAK